jgi:hypothetical protein
MTVRDKWLTEKQICDQLWDKKETFLNPWGDMQKEPVHYFREFPISTQYRPDFITMYNCIFPMGKKYRPIIHIYEVKITSDIYAVSQICEYSNSLTYLLSYLYVDQKYLNEPEIEVRKTIIARYFDKSTSHVALGAGVSLQRLLIKNKNIIGTSCEYSPDRDMDMDSHGSHFISKIKNRFPANKEYVDELV